MGHKAKKPKTKQPKPTKPEQNQEAKKPKSQRQRMQSSKQHAATMKQTKGEKPMKLYHEAAHFTAMRQANKINRPATKQLDNQIASFLKGLNHRLRETDHDVVISCDTPIWRVFPSDSQAILLPYCNRRRVRPSDLGSTPNSPPVCHGDDSPGGVEAKLKPLHTKPLWDVVSMPCPSGRSVHLQGLETPNAKILLTVNGG